MSSVPLRKQNMQAKEVYTSQSSATRKPEGITQEMFIRGGFALRSNPLPFYIPFFTKKVPLSYTFYWQIVPLSHTLFRTLDPF